MNQYKVKILYETVEFDILAHDDISARDEAKRIMGSVELRRKCEPQTLTVNKVICREVKTGRKVPVKCS